MAPKGLLAPINVEERHLTLGTGHCTAFVKAANAGCRTPISFIQDESGCINVEFLKKQKQFRLMLERGWEFTQLPWQVEVAWPSSPEILQRALNSTSEVASAVTELEGAVTIGECLETGESETSAIATATSGNPLWAPYAAVLAELARRYGGGRQVPLLHKLDSYAKKHGGNRRLGEELLHAVVYGFKYPDPTAHLPRVVDMLLTTNMVAPKVVDGVARCVTKSDVGQLSNAKKLPLMQEVEEHLERADTLCSYMLKNHPSAGNAESNFVSQVENLEGLFKVRLGAFLTKKGEATFERKTYASVNAVVETFLKDLFHILSDGGVPFECPIDEKWKAILAATKLEDEPAAAATSAETKLLTPEELKSKKEALLRAGFKPGTMVYEKAVGAKEGVFRN